MTKNLSATHNIVTSHQAEAIFYQAESHWITAAIIKATRNDIKGIKAILQKNPEYINDMDSSQRTALYYAAERGFIDMVSYLLTFSTIQVDSTREGYTPLLSLSRMVADPAMLQKQVNYMVKVQKKHSIVRGYTYWKIRKRKLYHSGWITAKSPEYNTITTRKGC